MSWIVPWNGKEYDVDPMTFDGLELSLVKQKAGFTFRDLLTAIPNMDGDAIRVLFWIVDQRDDPALLFGSYRGPTLEVVLPHLTGFVTVVERVGKAMEIPATPTTETDGSPGSPSSSDTPDPSMTS